jgi:uncharacterized protein (TIGR02145 family)
MSSDEPRYYLGDYRGNSLEKALKSKYISKFGVLYNFTAAKEACPQGWHLPMNSEWEKLSEFISNSQGPFQKLDSIWKNVGAYLKSKNDWKFNGNGNDLYGFDAKPGGVLVEIVTTTLNYSRRPTGKYDLDFTNNPQEAMMAFKDEYCYFWAIDQTKPSMPLQWSLVYLGDIFMNQARIKPESGLNIRCIKD